MESFKDVEEIKARLMLLTPGTSGILFVKRGTIKKSELKIEDFPKDVRIFIVGCEDPHDVNFVETVKK